MVRFVSILVLGVAGWTALAPASAWSQQPRPTAPLPSQKDTHLPQGDELLAELLGRAMPKLDSAELVGMAAETKPPMLSLEQAYSLTLIRARNPGATFAVAPGGIFDAKALDEQAKRSGAGDFDRFRREFLSSPVISLPRVIERLEALHGEHEPPAITDPWEMSAYRRMSLAGGESGELTGRFFGNEIISWLGRGYACERSSSWWLAFRPPPGGSRFSRNGVQSRLR
jgi:hypothetical protein